MAKPPFGISASPSTQPPVDDSLPAIDDPGIGAPENNLLSLTPEQLQSAGLDQLMPGDSFSVRITGTVNSADNGLTAEITGASEGAMEGGEELPAEPPDEREPMKAGPQSPKAAGFNFPNGDETDY